MTIITSSLADIGSTFEATAHLIPQIDVGISVLGDIASASVFMDLDASADFTASTTSTASPQPCVTASADINVGVGAQDSFFGLFNASVVKSLFDKRFPLFQVRAQGLPYTNFFIVEYFSFRSPDRNVSRKRIRLRRPLSPLRHCPI